MDTASFLALGGFAAACLAAASTGGIFKPGDWYRGLDKPQWTPPDLAFPVVWSILYLMITFAGWRIFNVAGPEERFVFVAIYGLQLFLNGFWSYLFFGLKRMDWALADVVALWLSIAALIAVALPIDPAAALLFAPYLLWVTVAGALNFSVLRRNPQARFA